MSTNLTAGTATSGASLSSDTSGSLVLVSGSTSQYSATVPQITGNVLVETAVSSSSTNTVTNKVAVSIGGTTYYLLASTSGT